MSAAAVVPYRGADHHRRANAETVLRWLAAMGVPAVLAEHADAADAGIAVPAGTQRVHVGADGAPFSKAAACNAGFVAAGASTVAFVDADTLMPAAAFLACIDALGDTFDAIRPFAYLIELDEGATASVARTGELPPAPVGGRDDARGGERIPLCGGIVIVRASAFEAAGGFDESFAGWGGEDDALSAALIRSGARCATVQQGPAFHLWHARTPASRYGHERYAANLERARWWTQAPEGELAAAYAAGRAALARRRLPSA